MSATAQMRRVVLKPYFSSRAFNMKGIIRPAAPVPAYFYQSWNLCLRKGKENEPT
jgi:hypothetical protein